MTKRFIVQTGTALVIKDTITPEEYDMVEHIEEHTSEGIMITPIRPEVPIDRGHCLKCGCETKNCICIIKK